MPIRKELLDELLKEYQEPDDLLGKDGLLAALTKALVERALETEMTHHLGYEKHATEGRNGENSRNGKTSKTIRGKNGEIEIEVPRDRDASFEPKLVPKRKRRFDGFDEKIVALYGRGMSVRDIQGHLEELYGVEVSPDLISIVTKEVLDEVRSWQTRTLDAVYPILYLDALYTMIRDRDGRVKRKAIHLAIGINLRGKKEVLGMWIAENEGAKFWLSVLSEIKGRGVTDVFIACVDGLKGFPEAIESVFTQTVVQCCVVHQVRNSLAFVADKQMKDVARDLKTIYRAPSEQAALAALDAFGATWDASYPTITKSWRANWSRLRPMFELPDAIRRAIYTTNTIESLNYTLRKVLKNRPVFPDDDAALKVLYLALRNAAKKWTMPITDWKRALNQMAIIFGDRVPLQLD